MINQKNGRAFLAFVLEKLNMRIRALGQSLMEGQREIEDMHDYYWQNYTEMDEYGYENYDNQQALLQQVNANEEQILLRRRFRKMLDSPFFGRVDFCYEGDEEPETFYIGIGTFAEKTGQVPLIYDWRSPVSGLFYDFDKGPASYAAPMGELSGEITSKWQYKIKNGKMVYEFESDMKIDDEILQAELGTNGEARLKNIIRTIQKEQNAIIRNTRDRILVIQGAAGSGKTSVALHRIAYLLYHDRGSLKSSNVLILSPNGVFSDYISHILPELGEEAIQEMSFDFFAWQQLKDTAADCEDRFDQIERELRGGMGQSRPEAPCAGEGQSRSEAPCTGEGQSRSEAPCTGEGQSRPEAPCAECGQSRSEAPCTGEGQSRPEAPCAECGQSRSEAPCADIDQPGGGGWLACEKQSQGFLDRMEGFFLGLEDDLMNFSDVEYQNFTMTEGEILTLFYDKFAGIPLLSRMDAIAEVFIDQVETLKNADLPEEERAAILEAFHSMYETMDFYVLYNRFLESEGCPTLPDVPLEERFLRYEDVYPILYLKYRLQRQKERQNIRHLVVDEMQDYSRLQYRILACMFSCPMTILGDRAQTIGDSQQDALTFLPGIFGKDTRRIVMNKSYRNTVEICSYANQLLGITDVELPHRHGIPVDERMFVRLSDALYAVAESLKLGEDAYLTAVKKPDASGKAYVADGTDPAPMPDGFETAAVILRTQEEAKEAYELLEKLLSEAGFDTKNRLSLLHRDSQSFQKGLTVTTFYLAKGLEFDQVFSVFPAADQRPLTCQARYIAATRALHELHVFHLDIPLFRF